MNAGEIDELKAVLTLIYCRDNNVNGVRNVGLEHEYRSHNKTIEELKVMDDRAIISLSSACGVVKAKASYKADVRINGEGYSLKSHRKALPALLNHTHRAGIIKVCNRINLDISVLDSLIGQYWDNRINRVHGEDVKYTDSVFAQGHASMVQLLEYFLFVGTANGISPFPAVALYSFNDPFNFSSWQRKSRSSAASEMIRGSTISLRNKGMMGSYSDSSTSTAHTEMRPWVRNVDGSDKGSLHIRG